tara:strand:+ start:74 stop:265 length:192 start_codon:yes stop_codon:yes gene_type:complete
MTWDYYDIKKNKNIEREIDATSMHLPKYEKLKGKAMYRLLLKHYTGPELENELIEMMEKIASR